MPVVKVDPFTLTKREIGVDQVEPTRTTTFADRLYADYRLENTIGSYLNQESGLPDDTKETDFDSWSLLDENERLDQRFVKSAAYADSAEELEALRRQRDREIRDRKIRDEGGLAEGIFRGVLVAGADPVNYIPIGGAAYTSYRSGGSILQNALATATAANLSTVAAETLLHQTQLTRTFGESAANVTAATFLGGVLGATPGTISKLFSKQQLDEIEKTLNPEGTLKEGGNPTMSDASLSAAKIDQDAQVRGEFAKKFVKLLSFDPLSRTITSDSAATRIAVNALVENPIEMDRFVGQAVESLANIHSGKVVMATQMQHDIFHAYKKGGGQLTRREFREEVGKAMRNGSEDPSVQEAADAWRAQVYEPMKKEAIEMGLLPEDVDVDTAESYLNRMWNAEKIAADLPRFIDTVEKWLNSQNAENKIVQEQVTTRYDRIKQAEKSIERAERAAATAQKRTEQLTKQLAEVQRLQQAGVERKMKLDEIAVQKAIKQQRQLDAKIAKAMLEEFQKFQDGKVQSLEKGRTKAIREIEKEIKALEKSQKRGRLIAEYGGLNRDAWEAEGIDPAFFQDKSVKGGFGKPVFRKDGGLTPDDLAEKLWEDGIIPEKDANMAIDYVDETLRFGDDFVDPRVSEEVDYLTQAIDELNKATDQDIIDVFMGGPIDEVAPTGVSKAPEATIGKATERELRIAYNRMKGRSNVLQKQLSGQQDKARLAQERADTIRSRYADDLVELEANIAKWQGKTSKAVKRTAQTREGELRTLTKELEQAAKAISTRDIDEVDTNYLAREIANRIKSSPDGRLPYEYKVGQQSNGGWSNDKLAGVFKERSFKIPDKLVEDFLENDIELLGNRYVKQMAPDIELTRRFGSVDINETGLLNRIQDDYDEMMLNAKTEKERLRLNKKLEADKRDIRAMWDRIRGVYAVPESNSIWVRAQRVARDLNYMRLLGGVVAASIPDVGRVIAAEGIAKTFSAGLVPMIKNFKAFKMSAADAKRYGVGVDALIGGRAEIIADVADYSRGGTAFERGVRAASDKFSSINLMNYWTGGIKQLHAVVAQTSIAEDLLKGKYTRQLSRLGISEADSRNIAEQLRQYGKKVDGVYVFNTKDWDNQDLATMWGAAIRKESDRVIIIPGQEKPLFMSTEAGKTFMQFRSFMFSATQRIMLSTIQRQDKHYIQGLMGLVSLGMLSYAFKQWDAGRELSDDPRAWVIEGIDRSGALGILMEANNTIEKVSGNNYGLRPLMNVAAPASRYASRSALDSLVGPTFGLSGDMLKVLSAASGQSDWTDSDTRAIRRLIPGQNLSILRQGFDKIEEAIK